MSPSELKPVIATPKEITAKITEMITLIFIEICKLRPFQPAVRARVTVIAGGRASVW
jgi:hypothetical protein